MPASQKEARFWDRIADRYARRPVPDEAVYQRKLEKTREYLRTDMTVLEFGCGTGTTAIAHAPYVASITAVDVSSRMLEIARHRAEEAGVVNLALEQASIDSFTAPPASTDAVLGLSLLHLLVDRKAALARVHALLKPGGVFVSSTPCLADGMNWFRPLAAIGASLGRIPRISFFTADALRADIKAAGFEIVEDWSPGKNAALFIIARKPPAPAPDQKS